MSGDQPGGSLCLHLASEVTSGAWRAGLWAARSAWSCPRAPLELKEGRLAVMCGLSRAVSPMALQVGRFRGTGPGPGFLFWDSRGAQPDLLHSTEAPGRSAWAVQPEQEARLCHTHPLSSVGWGVQAAGSPSEPGRWDVAQLWGHRRLQHRVALQPQTETECAVSSCLGETANTLSSFWDPAGVCVTTHSSIMGGTWWAGQGPGRLGPELSF